MIYVIAYVCFSLLIGFATMVHEIRHNHGENNAKLGFGFMTIGWPIFLPIFTFKWAVNSLYKLAERIA